MRGKRMAERGAIKFEPIVEFPDNPFDAACIYLGVMAYPELGAGQQGSQGARFTLALRNYVIWNHRYVRGLPALRKLLGNPRFKVSPQRSFERQVERGRRRILRRCAAFDIVGNQLINGFLNGMLDARRAAAAGRIGDAYDSDTASGRGAIRPEVIARATPSARRIIRRDIKHWSGRLGLNETGCAADLVQKERDLVSRGFLQSRPVLHLAHGLNKTLSKTEKTLEGWDKADWLLLLLWNAEHWVWQAIDDAVSWRLVAQWVPSGGLSPAQMIELIPPKKCKKLPAAQAGPPAA